MKQYEKSVTSQWGEDGVIEEIFRRIGASNKVAVEIGAWDGKHFSNTWNLEHNHGWYRLLSEKEEARRREIETTARTIVFGECQNIDRLCDVFKVDTSFDLLSIDIDGDDYYLWKDMVKYKPRVVVIEYNQTVPPHIDIVQERGGSFGASYAALQRLGAEKGYILVYSSVTNMIFINKNEYDKPDGMLHSNNNNYICFATKENVMPTDWLCHVVIGYNGKRYMIGQPAHNDNQGGKHEKLITDVKIEPI